MVHIRLRKVRKGESYAAVIDGIRRAYAFAFDRFDHAIRDAEISVVDVNGPRGGVDLVCRVQLRLRPRGILVAKTRNASALDAVRDACESLRHTLGRQLDKRRSQDRQRDALVPA